MNKDKRAEIVLSASNRKHVALPALIEKLRGLKGPDREVDAEIATAAAGYVYEKRKDDRKTWFYAPDGMRYQIHGYDYERLPRFTASLDAVTALIERDLPGWTIFFEAKDGVATDLYLIGPNYNDATGRGGAGPIAGVPVCIALLIAFLEAKMEMER